MDNDKQFLFTSGGSHILSCFLAFVLLALFTYDLLSGQCTVMREGNVYIGALLVFALLAYTSLLEACMMIKTKRHLFAYNVDKAICVSLRGNSTNTAIVLGSKLCGPVFDENSESHFSSTPKSTFTRKCFYCAIIMLLLVSLISPCYHLCSSLKTKALSSNIVAAWLLILMDCALIVNRIFFRASIRRFWAFTLGDANFRSILRFELSGEDAVEQPPFVVNSLADEDQQD